MQGIPLDVRPWAWMAMSGAATRKAGHMAGYFDAMLQNGEVSSECAHQIELVTTPTSVHLLTAHCPSA